MTTDLLRLLAASALAFTLGACGGGGGSADAVGGIDGTGSPPGKVFVRGPVTGFGSVIVDGVAYQTGSASFEIDDDSGSEQDLEIGQIVEVSASGGVATMVRYDAELEGPIDTIDAANSRFTALGVTVLVEGTTVFENTSLESLNPGDFVEVSGEFDANGDLHAAFVESRVGSAGEVEIKGIVSDHDSAARRFRLNALSVDYGSASFDPSSLVIADGQFVEVEGQLSDSLLIATEVELEDRDDDLDAGDEAEIEGFVSQVSSATEFTLGGVLVRHTGETEFEGGGAGDIVPNARLSVDGQVDASGVLVADEIEFDDEDGRDLRIEFEAPAQSTTASSITVLGVSFETRQNTVVRDGRDGDDELRVSGIQPGDFVRVRAFIDDGALIAGRIEREDTEQRVRVGGFLDSKDEAADLIVVQGVTIDLSEASFEQDRASFYADAMVGDFVQVDGQFDGNLVVADEVELGDD